jgi:nucleotide-binding universal stress UspA family protein
MKILLGYKEGRIGKRTMEVAVKQAKAFDGEVLIVTSLEGGDKTETHEIDEVEKNFEQIKVYFDEAGIKNETQLLIRGLETGEDIVKFAKEKNVDLVIIGVKNRSKVGKLLFGSTAQAVILESLCPVLVVK